MPPSLNMFPLFSSLPLEIRQKIWFYSLPGPRTILITPNPNSLPGKTARGTHLGSESKYVAAPASYGGHQPAILSVNRESRAEARRYLTPLFDTYWNLDIDAPYFELPQGDNSKEEVMLPRAMREAGELDMFKHIAIDWFIWHWEDATRTMEFQRTFGRRLNYFEHPIATIKQLPNIKTCTFVYTNHTMQKDLVESYVPWVLGPLHGQGTLEPAEMDARREFDSMRKEIEDRPDLDFRCQTIYHRSREYLPPNLLYRPKAGWEMDWFG